MPSPRSLCRAQSVGVVPNRVEDRCAAPARPVGPTQLADKSARRVRDVAERVEIVVAARRDRQDLVHIGPEAVQDIPTAGEQSLIRRRSETGTARAELRLPEKTGLGSFQITTSLMVG
jgi:hypothetical protein